MSTIQTVYAVFAAFVIVLMALGIAGNLLVVLVLKNQSTCKRMTGRQFLISLAIADIGGSINLIFMLTTMLSNGDWLFGEELCQLNGSLAVLFGSASMWTLGIISLNRYVRIVKQPQYSAIFTKSSTVVLLVVSWSVPLLLSIAPIFGWSAHQYQFDKFSCHFRFSEDISYTTVFILVIVMTPFLAIMFSYANIYRVTRDHRRANSSLRRHRPYIHIEEIRITGTLFVVILAFMFCFMPGSVVNIVEMVRPNAAIPSWLDSVSYLLVVTNHANNPLIYGFLNRSLRKAFWKCLRNSCLCFLGEAENNSAVESSLHRSKRSSLRTAGPNSPSTGRSTPRCNSYVTGEQCLRADLV